MSEQAVKTPFETALSRINVRLSNRFCAYACENAAMFLDPGLEIAVNRVVPATTISESFKSVYTYKTNKQNFGFDVVVILTSGEPRHLETYIKLINATTMKPKRIDFMFTGRMTIRVQQTLESHGYFTKDTERIRYNELDIPAWILDPDLATLELESTFTEQLTEGGFYNAEKISETIMNMGRTRTTDRYFTNMYYIGQGAVRVAEKISDNFQSPWTHIIVFDRSCDLVTPFMTPETYESVVADYVPTSYGIVVPERGHPVKMSNEDKLSSYLRNMSWYAARKEVKERFESYKQLAIETEQSTDQPVTTAIKRIADETLENLSIGDHIDLVTYIDKEKEAPWFQKNMETEFACVDGAVRSKDFIRENIAYSKDWRTPVRYLALFCQTSQKVVDDLDPLRQMIIDRYGMEALAALWSLERAGLVVDKMKPTNWQVLRSAFNLVEYDQPGKPRSTSALVYEGHVPLIVRLLQKIMSNDWNSCRVNLDQKKLGIPFRVFGNRCDGKKRVLVVFVGGSTYGEVTSLRLLKPELKIEVDVLTTKMLSARSLLDDLAGIDRQ